VKKAWAQKCFVLFSVVACILASLSTTHEIVLCFGGDGHVALEPAHEGMCPSVAHDTSDENCRDESVVSSPRSRDHHCECCVDIPLGMGLHLEAPIPHPSGKRLVSAMAFHGIYALTERLGSPILLDNASPSIRTISPALRTVVLII